jgi:hypothetical protein
MNRLLAVDPLQIQDFCNDELRDGRHKLHEEQLDYSGLRAAYGGINSQT